ncbi:hypothetical protein Tco_1510066 [Tanacetum coccineum]
MIQSSVFLIPQETETHVYAQKHKKIHHTRRRIRDGSDLLGYGSWGLESLDLSGEPRRKSLAIIGKQKGFDRFGTKGLLVSPERLVELDLFQRDIFLGSGGFLTAEIRLKYSGSFNAWITIYPYLDLREGYFKVVLQLSTNGNKTTILGLPFQTTMFDAAYPLCGCSVIQLASKIGSIGYNSGSIFREAIVRLKFPYIKELHLQIIHRRYSIEGKSSNFAPALVLAFVMDFQRVQVLGS